MGESGKALKNKVGLFFFQNNLTYLSSHDEGAFLTKNPNIEICFLSGVKQPETFFATIAHFILQTNCYLVIIFSTRWFA